MARRLAVVLGVLGLLGHLSPRLEAATTPAQRCAAAKMTAAGKKAVAKLKCERKALAKNRAVAPGCLAKAERRFGAAFAKAEVNGGCATTGDADKIEAMVDGFMNDMVGSLSPTPGATTTTATTTTSIHVPTSAVARRSTTTIATTGPLPTRPAGGSSTTAMTPTSIGSSTSTVSTDASTTVTSSSSTTASTAAVVIPCGGISPDCSGSCPPGLVCAAMPGEFCACIGS